MTPLQSSQAAQATPVLTPLQQLRASTRFAHARIENALPLLSPGLTLSRYLGVLAAFYGFYAPFESALLEHAGTHTAPLELERRVKLPLLELDLGALGKSRTQIEAISRCARLPRIESASQALGALYVLEGATLGGQIIGRKLHATLGLRADSGAAFFGGYGAQTGAMWKRFSNHVDSSPAVEIEAAVGSAIETFEKLQSWLEAAQTEAR